MSIVAPSTKVTDEQRTILAWRDNPVKFVNDMFNVTPDVWQQDALMSLVTNDKISIRSGHGVGKSAYAAWSVIWFLSTRYPCKVPCAAPTLHQLKDVLWAELSTWHRRMPKALRDEFTIKCSDQDMSMCLKSAPRESFAVARTGRKDNPEALQGFHSDNLMFVLDEASGIDDVVFEVAQGALSTPGSKVIMCANPTRSSGYFYDSHHKMRDRWHTIKVSCIDAIRASEQYPKDVAQQYGIDSNVYRVRVLGEFPEAEDDVLVPLHLLESALARDVEPSGNIEPIWGLDVARFGNDRTALAKRVGSSLPEKIKSWHGADLMQTVGRVVDEYRQTDDITRPRVILVDSIGMGGGVVDRLRELGLPVQGINVAETPTGDRFNKLRDELWWLAREWFEKRDCALIDDETLVAELSSVKYKLLSTGKLQVESKDDMKKRTTGGKSPDLADAFCLTFAAPDSYRGSDPSMDRYQKAVTRVKRFMRGGKSKSWKSV